MYWDLILYESLDREKDNLTGRVSNFEKKTTVGSQNYWWGNMILQETVENICYSKSITMELIGIYW